MDLVIDVKNLSKTFGANKAVDNLSFSVKKGSLFAFLGQNGAGKSTTINMLIGLLPKDGGEIYYNGSQDYKAFKNQIGTVYQSNILDDLLTGEENLTLYGSFYSDTRRSIKTRFDELVSLFRLNDYIKRQIKTLSGGQRRKLEIARALWNNPQVLFLDEPTTGLDPKTRLEVWDSLHQIRLKNSMTVFLTTHYMEETSDADNVVIIHKGRLVAQGSPAELKAQYSSDRLLITPQNAEEFEKSLNSKNLTFEKVADTYILRHNSTEQSIELLYELRTNIRFYESIKGSMDDVFLNAAGEKIGSGEGQ